VIFLLWLLLFNRLKKRFFKINVSLENVVVKYSLPGQACDGMPTYKNIADEKG
jgi:hypothetical protein